MQNSLLDEYTSIRAESESRLANAFGIKKFFPYLDMGLINKVIHQNSCFFSSNKNSSRDFSRNAFKEYIPTEIYKDPSKNISADSLEDLTIDSLREQLISKLSFCNNLHPLIEHWFDKNKLEMLAINSRTKKEMVIDAFFINRLNIVNNWLIQME